MGPTLKGQKNNTQPKAAALAKASPFPRLKISSQVAKGDLIKAKSDKGKVTK